MSEFREDHLVLWRGAVHNWQRGQAGHINIQHYAQIADDASRALGHELGFDAVTGRSDGAIVRCDNEQYRFLVELTPGTLLAATGGVEEINDGWVVLGGALRRVRDDRVICLFRRRVRPFRADDATFAAWPAAALERAERVRIEPIEGLRPVDGPTGDAGVETYRGTVEPHESNEFELLSSRGLWDKLTRGLWAAQGAIGADRSTTQRLGLAGGAAVFDLTHVQQIPLGTALVIRTSVLEAREGSLRMEHLVLGAQSNELFVRVRYVLAFIERSSGKRVPVPPEILRAAKEL